MTPVDASKLDAVQAPQGITFALHSLGWKAFQDLCGTILRETWGQTAQLFSESRDGGRDGAFDGQWTASSGEAFEGPFVVQCKFTARRDHNLSRGELADEFSKAKRLASRGLALTYVLITNARVSGVVEQEIRSQFLGLDGISHFGLYGYEWICAAIRDSPRLRMLVPRVYGLGDLSQILDSRAYVQATEILSSLGEDLSKFVITAPYRESAQALLKHGFVLLLGEPASGKSTIAAALALAATDQWGCQTLKVRSADEFVRHSNPHETKQFFWIDDAFGATQVDYGSAAAWSGVFPHMIAAIRRGARIVFTSRSYVFQAARQRLKESAFPLLAQSQVIIYVESLTRAEREQILYNHLKLGKQPSTFRSDIKRFLHGTASLSEFSPETARRLSDPFFTTSLRIEWGAIKAFVARPIRQLQDLIRTLDASSRAALAVVFMRGGALLSPIEFSRSEERAVELIGSTLAGVRDSLNFLNESLVLRVREAGSQVWRFKHPTIRDAFAELVADDSDLIDIYLTGAAPERLLDEVTCGDVGFKGVRVIVPENRNSLLIERLGSLGLAVDAKRTRLLIFLARRCDQQFLKDYISANPEFVSGLRVWSYLSVVPDIDVILRLQNFGLLEEQRRVSVVKEIADLAISIPDAGFLGDEFRVLFKNDEREAILARVRDELIPDLDAMVDNWRDNFSNRDGDPGGYFESLVESLESYKEEFAQDLEACVAISRSVEDIEGVVESLREDYVPREDEGSLGRFESPPSPSRSRSVFDDLEVDD